MLLLWGGAVAAIIKQELPRSRAIDHGPWQDVCPGKEWPHSHELRMRLLPQETAHG